MTTIRDRLSPLVQYADDGDAMVSISKRDLRELLRRSWDAVDRVFDVAIGVGLSFAMILLVIEIGKFMK